MASIRNPSTTAIVRLRSSRSARAPPRSAKNSHGSDPANDTAAMLGGRSGQRCREQRNGREGDAVAEVRHGGRGPEAHEVGTESDPRHEAVVPDKASSLREHPDTLG